MDNQLYESEFPTLIELVRDSILAQYCPGQTIPAEYLVKQIGAWIQDCGCDCRPSKVLHMLEKEGHLQKQYPDFIVPLY